MKLTQTSMTVQRLFTQEFSHQVGGGHGSSPKALKGKNFTWYVLGSNSISPSLYRRVNEALFPFLEDRIETDTNKHTSPLPSVMLLWDRSKDEIKDK